MSEQSNIAVVRDLYASLSKSDMAHVRDLLHDQTTLQVSGKHPHAGAHVGGKAALEFFTKMRQMSSEVSLEPQTIAATGDQVLALVHIHGERKQASKILDADDVHVLTVADGKITQFKSFHSDQHANEEYLS